MRFYLSRVEAFEKDPAELTSKGSETPEDGPISCVSAIL
jgi:hypothetical protein